MQYAYLFETRGIQRFLFASGKLRDMLGGSELLDYLCADNGLLDQTLRSLDLQPAIARKAGGAFYLLFDQPQQAERLQAVWRLACAQWLPGVEQIDAIATGATAREAVANGLQQLRAARNRLQPDLPRPGPLAERSPRTGLAAVHRERGESLDAATAQQRLFKRPDDGQQLAQRFLDESGLRWPVNFEENSPLTERFPLGERRLVGLVHADGNGLGELLRVLNAACAQADDATYVRLYRTFSEGLAEATLAAARQASREVLLPSAVNDILPARPLVLGGDDLTVLVRADLALPFAKAFLTAFEAHSRTSMQQLLGAFEEAGLGSQAAELPGYLTACAGLCYMKCSQPFHAGHEIAEGLCKRAKAASRTVRPDNAPMPATLAFHKIQDSLVEDAETLFDQQHRVRHGNQIWQTSLSCYALKPAGNLPALGDLERLLGIFAGPLNDRPLRELATLIHISPDRARQAYIRWRDLALRNHPAELAAFDESLHALIGRVRNDLPFCEQENPTSPLDDLLALLTLHSGTPQTQESH